VSPRQILSLVALGCAAVGVGAALAAPSALPRVPRYGVFERAFRFTSTAANPWEEVRLDVTLTAPDGRHVSIGGFYAGGTTWKFRFAPWRVGRWAWTARIADSAHAVTHRGNFVVVPGASPGFVVRSPFNRFRWAFSNGKPYHPIGLQDCTVAVYTDNPLTGLGFDGGHGTPPRWTSLEPYLTTFAAAGFNLFRWGPNNCSFGLYDRIDSAGNVYSRQGGDYTDRLVTLLHRHAFRIELVLFGRKLPFASGFESAAQFAAVERYVRYMVDRFGASVDFWELTNEATVPSGWITSVARYLRSVDPYRRPIGTSWSRPDLPALDFGSDHWYQTEPDLDSDRVAWQRLRGEPARRYGKPTVVDEQGNAGHNWDPTSAVRMRLRAWTAFFAEATIVFWNTSATKDYAAETANVYVGPEERGYIRVLSRYTAGFDPRARVVTPPVPGRSDLRAYALRGPAEYGLYLVDGASHSTRVTGARVVVDPARAGNATWIDPATGRTLASSRVRAGRQTLRVPPFTTDVALKVARG
jgi:hypothetical protein